MCHAFPKTCLCLAVALALSACNTAPKTAEKRDQLHTAARESIADFQQKDSRLQHYFDTAYGYAIFPAIGQGAVGVGGAYGHGEVYRNGQFVGYCNVTQGTLGAQLGGQTFSEVIFFENQASFDQFKSGQLAFDASANAIAADKAASATADYQKGVLVFTKGQGGLMFQAAIGGQKFNYESQAMANDEP